MTAFTRSDTQTARLKGSLIGFGMLVTSIGVATAPPPVRLIGYESFAGSRIPTSPVDHDYDQLLISTAVIAVADHPATIASLERSADLIKRVHSGSGLTWDQLSRLFGVSRRALHHWASGGRLNATNYELLEKTYRVIEGLPEHGPAAKRSELLRPRSSGLSIFDELRSQHAARRNDINSLPYEPSQLIGFEHQDEIE